mmetsp:Transcript_13586/g.15755  ORF Transcript_13586/g.15755 Transcript_13586/m.15755 type:complete len:246 (-) Transcript_13586:123-860(-)
MKKLTDKLPVYLYPGYYCSNYEGATCAFSDKICGKDGICVGVYKYGNCQRSADCYYGNFCESGKCVPELKSSQFCMSHEACGRQGYCLHSNADVNFGYCVQYASIESNSTYPILAFKNGQYLYQENAEKVCKSGWLNKSTGKCAPALKSKNKGQPCNFDSDCPTSDSSVNASCKCSFSGALICDISGGDSEWTDAFDKFQAYIEKTKEYHSSEYMGSCMESQEYRDWFCAEFEAKHFTELQSKPS